MRRPLIGISTGRYTDEARNLTYSRIYAPISDSIARVGGLPVAIPTGLDEETLRAIYECMDGVLLPGGPDVDPAYYGDTEVHHTVYIDEDRDEIELPLARWAYNDDVPLFGICRGHQVINVALGGKLYQDIPAFVETDLVHDTPSGEPRHLPRHEVTIDPDSTLARILGDTAFGVNSLHHQAVREAAPNAIVTATSDDGVVEATEFPGKQFAMSVQWHPEDMIDSNETMLRLFEAFVNAARERANAKA